MNSLNSANTTCTKGDAAAYHKHFNPPEGGNQRRSIHAKKRGKHKSETKKRGKQQASKRRKSLQRPQVKQQVLRQSTHDMLRVDRNITVGTNTEANAWAIPQELPTGKVFSKVFSVKQETRNNNLRIIMNADIKTVWKWQDLKGDRCIYQYLWKNNIFFRINQFDSEEKTDIVGYILELHPTLVCKEELVSKLKVGLEEAKATNNRDVDE
eukprot:6816023-Ditylum_brightwellii.AAC.1